MLQTCSLNIITASAGLFPLLNIPHWEGRISAVFRTTLQITGPKERLIHLQGDSLLLSPFSIRTPSDLARIIADIPLVQGTPVSKDGLWIEAQGNLRLSLEKIYYYCSPSMVTGWIDPRALDLVEQTVQREGNHGGLMTIPTGQVATRAIRNALTGGELDRLLAGILEIIGLGPGLTPSGDDFLVGWIKGLSLFTAYNPKLYDTISLLRSSIVPHLHKRTSRIGAEFIRYALDGQYSEILDQAAAAIVTPTDVERRIAAVRRLLTQGGSSGTDTAQGLLASLNSLRRANWLANVASQG